MRHSTGDATGAADAASIVPRGADGFLGSRRSRAHLRGSTQDDQFPHAHVAPGADLHEVDAITHGGA